MATEGNQSTRAMLSTLLGAMNSAKEKWDASGANEAMGRMASNLPAGTREFIAVTSTQMFNRQNLRSPAVLFGIGEERPYYIEKSPPLLMARLKHNFSFFYLNYLMVLVILFCFTLMISPISILGILILGGAWFYVIRHTQQAGNLIVYGIVISQTNATIGMTIISVAVLFWLLYGIFSWALFSSGFLIATHAVFRDASMHQDGDDRMDMVGEVGEDAAFLGANPSGKFEAV